MNRMEKLIFVLCFISALVLYGCASSEESTEKKETPPPVVQKPSDQAPSPQPEIATKVDTVHVVNVQTSPKPSYEPTPTNEPAAGNFAVQIGAFKMQESAERAAVLAKERFGKDVTTLPDKLNNLFKVLVGSFTMKDDARKFRDEILQKFPAEYKDAWVTEITQK